MGNQLPTIEPDEFCNARTRDADRCRNVAGYKTDHVGEGRCRYHGGATPTKHGLYSQLSSHRLSDRIEELREDPDLLELRDRIALQAAVIEDYLAGVGTQDNVTAADAKTLIDLVEKASRNLARLHKLEHGEKRVLTIQSVEVLIARVVTVVRAEAGDDAAERVGQRLLEAPA